MQMIEFSLCFPLGYARDIYRDVLAYRNITYLCNGYWWQKVIKTYKDLEILILGILHMLTRYLYFFNEKRGLWCLTKGMASLGLGICLRLSGVVAGKQLHVGVLQAGESLVRIRLMPVAPRKLVDGYHSVWVRHSRRSWVVPYAPGSPSDNSRNKIDVYPPWPCLDM